MSNLEQKILEWSGKILTFSVVVMIAIPALVFGAIAIYLGQFELLRDPLFYVAVAVGLAYLTSAYFLFTLNGKTDRRRLLSWCQSSIFHCCFFAGVALYLHNTGDSLTVLVILTPELTIGILSAIGVVASLKTEGETYA